VTLTAKDVVEITRLLEESSFDELYLELDGVKLSLKRGASANRAPSTASGPHTPATQLAGAPGATENASPVNPTAGQANSSDRTVPVGAAPLSPLAPTTPGLISTHGANGNDPSLHNVSSPLLGTFYRAPKPGAPPYVDVGSTVDEDTIVGIIEVMKLMNTVRAGARGRVVEILARDGTLVEYGETLLRIGKLS
jgi:acetyl-CoA carboxylase biotin carboxyl carrier protein